MTPDRGLVPVTIGRVTIGRVTIGRVMIGQTRWRTANHFRHLLSHGPYDMPPLLHDDSPLNQTPCPRCDRDVDDRAPACPYCGERIYVEHPGDITPTRHHQLPMNRPDEPMVPPDVDDATR